MTYLKQTKTFDGNFSFIDQSDQDSLTLIDRKMTDTARTDLF